MTMIRIIDRNGTQELVCPMCLTSVPYPLTGFNCELKEGHLTVIQKHPKKGENPYRIDWTKEHGPNCDFTLVNAPVEVVVVKAPVASDSSQDTPEGQ